MPTVPDEICQVCQKVITRRMKASLLGEMIVCASCYNRAKDREAEEQSWNGPATEAQIDYATSLGLSFPATITKLEMRDLLDSHLGEDPRAPAWLIQYSSQVGATFTRYSGTALQYARVAATLASRSDVELAAWLIYHVCRKAAGRGVENDPRQFCSPEFARWAATQLVADASALRSLKKNCGGDTRNAFELLTGRTTVNAWQAAKRLVRNASQA